MNYFFKIFLTIGLAFALHSINAQVPTTPAIQKIDQLFHSLYQSNRPGAAFAIIKDGKLLYKQTKGLARIEQQAPINFKTRFNIASVSKQITTYMAFLLQDQARLSFNDHIEIYLPELKHLPHSITIKQLTNHTHGLPNVDELARLKGTDRMSHTEIVDMLLQLKQLNFIPGSSYEYNNSGYVLLAEILQRITNTPFNKLIQEQLFSPLQMNDSKVIGHYNTLLANKANSYVSTNNTYTKSPVNLSTSGASGVHASLNDLIKWAQNFHQTKLGKKSFFNTMQQPTLLKKGKKIDYGMGLQFENYKGLDIVFHGGGTQSYRSYILHAPTQNLSLIFLSNAGGFSGLDMIYKSLDYLTENHHNKSDSPKPTLHIKDLQKFAGTYELFPGNYYTFIIEKNQLYFQPFGTQEKTLLPPITTTRFTFPALPYASFKFYNNKFDFRFADFTYTGKKVNIRNKTIAKINLKKFVGVYKNKALSTNFSIELKNNTLVAVHPMNGELPLVPLTKNSFYSPTSFIGKIVFTMNTNGKPIGFTYSGQNIKNLHFKK